MCAILEHLRTAGPHGTAGLAGCVCVRPSVCAPRDQVFIYHSVSVYCTSYAMVLVLALHLATYARYRARARFPNLVSTADVCADAGVSDRIWAFDALPHKPHFR